MAKAKDTQPQFESKAGKAVFVDQSQVAAAEGGEAGHTTLHLSGGSSVVVKGEPADVWNTLSGES